MCKTLLLSIKHPMVRCCLLITLFGIHCAYGLSLNPKSDSVAEKKSYHRRALSIIPYIAFNISTDSTFLQFSYVTNFLYSGFTLHIITTNSPSNFMCITLSPGSYAWRYATGTSKVCIDIPLWASINNYSNISYSAMVDDFASSRRI